MSLHEERERVRAMPAPLPGRPPEPRVPSPHRFELENGLRVVAVRAPALPQVVLRLVLPAGSITDPDGLSGAGALLGELLIEGTSLRDADALNARLDLLGASLDVHVGHDFAEIELFLLSETLPEALPLLAEVITGPALPAHELDRLREEALDGLVARQDEPANVADDRVARAVFGDAHAYGRPSIGTVEGVEAVTRESLLELHQRLYRPAGAFVVAAGDLEPDLLREQLAGAFRDWRGVPDLPARPPVPDAAREAGGVVRVAWPDAQQAELRVAGIGLARRSPDWIPAAVANFILGGSTITGRLGANLREEKGWTYGVRSSFSGAVQPGGWMVETAVESRVARKALAEIEGEIERMRAEPVSEEELERARDALVLSLPRAFETPARIVNRFVTLEAFGLPADYWVGFAAAVRAVDREAVRRVARRYFDPQRLVRVTVGEPI